MVNTLRDFMSHNSFERQADFIWLLACRFTYAISEIIMLML